MEITIKLDESQIKLLQELNKNIANLAENIAAIRGSEKGAYQEMKAQQEVKVSVESTPAPAKEQASIPTLEECKKIALDAKEKFGSSDPIRNALVCVGEDKVSNIPEGRRQEFIDHINSQIEEAIRNGTILPY